MTNPAIMTSETERLLATGPIEIFMDLVRMRFEQVTRFGHTAARDDARNWSAMIKRARRYVYDAGDTLSLSGSLDHLAAARGKAVKAAALIIAIIERIDRETARIEQRQGREHAR